MINSCSIANPFLRIVHSPQLTATFHSDERNS